jgi:hypothetical protein
MEERLFTVAEANSLIPRLRTILPEVGDEWTHVRELQPEIQKARENASFDGYSPFGVEYIQSVSHLMYLIHQIREMGVLLKDIDQGLCDFPYMRQGRVVYLCWRLGEDAIEYWHDIESGFAGREPLDKTDL